MRDAGYHSSLLINEPPLLIIRSLAKRVGLNEAIVLQQLHYWLQKSENIRDGRRWVYNSYPEWHRQFEFWCEKTIKRTISSLEKMGLVISANYNAEAFDKTKWYTIDYEKLSELEDESRRSGQIVPTKGSRSPDLEVSLSRPIPESTPKSTTESTSLSNESDSAAAPKTAAPYGEIIETYNKTCVSLPKVTKITNKRRRAMKCLWDQYPEIEAIREIFVRVERSTFLSGRSGRWHGCSFDWIATSDHAVKIMEGVYDDHRERRQEEADTSYAEANPYLAELLKRREQEVKGQ